MKVSIIIPCYDEEEGIPYLAHVLKKLIPRIRKLYAVELIFVDDGSKDNTLKLLKKYFGKLKFVKILAHKENKGFGAAFRTGIINSTGEVVFQLDADCTYPTKDIMDMIADTKHYDIVTASPYHPKGRMKDIQKYRWVLSKSVSLIYGFISGSKIYTFTSYFRAYKGDALRNLEFKSNGFTCTAEIMLLTLLKGGKVKEYPSVFSKRRFGQSKMRTLKVIMEHLGLIARILWVRIASKRA